MIFSYFLLSITAPDSPVSSSSTNIVLEPDRVVDEEAAVACVVNEVDREVDEEVAVVCLQSYTVFYYLRL